MTSNRGYSDFMCTCDEGANPKACYKYAQKLTMGCLHEEIYLCKKSGIEEKRGHLLEGDVCLGAYGMVTDTRPSCHLS